ncbi:MAG: carbohydrate-binding protein [Akkermansiaceae bacterium]|nr:carbohydrate-binding protein [Akkermansiaceae bacterium]
MRLAKGTNTIGAIDVRLDSPTGPIIGSLTNFVTGGNNTFVTFPRPFPQTVTGARDLYFVFTGQGTGNVVDVDWFEITE